MVGKKILVSLGYKFLSLSDLLRKEFSEKTGEDATKADRAKLQEFGNTEREKEAACFAKKIVKEIEEDSKTGTTKWVVDSIRNPAEIRHLREYSRNFFLFGIYADKEKRWNRVKGKYSGSRDRFEEDDKRDRGEDQPPHGQRVRDSFAEADVVLTNDEHSDADTSNVFKKLRDAVDRYAKLVANPLKRDQPTDEERHMAMAYAAAQGSSCLQRKVGAVIVDRAGTIISSGFNEVAPADDPCSQRYGECFRDRERTKFLNDVVTEFPAIGADRPALEKLFKERFRILDICRALHAEESAIINLARNARAIPARECTVYTTTYPCRLCAKKIASVNFERVIYVAPYPDDEAKSIFERQRGLKTAFFQGVTYRAYFRVYGDEIK